MTAPAFLRGARFSDAEPSTCRWCDKGEPRRPWIGSGAYHVVGDPIIGTTYQRCERAKDVREERRIETLWIAVAILVAIALTVGSLYLVGLRLESIREVPVTDFLMGAYSCGALLFFGIGILVRDPIPGWLPPAYATRVPVWEVALYAAAWPLVAVWVALELWRDAR